MIQYYAYRKAQGGRILPGRAGKEYSMPKKKRQKECLACNGTGKVSGDRLYLLGFKHSIQRNEDIPAGARNLAVSLIDGLLQVMYSIPGSLELSYRRGIQEGEERKPRR